MSAGRRICQSRDQPSNKTKRIFPELRGQASVYPRRLSLRERGRRSGKGKRASSRSLFLAKSPHLAHVRRPRPPFNTVQARFHHLRVHVVVALRSFNPLRDRVCLTNDLCVARYVTSHSEISPAFSYMARRGAHCAVMRDRSMFIDVYPRIYPEPRI